MLPTGDGNSTQRRQAGGLDFINQQDLSKTGKEAKILAVRLKEKGSSKNPGPSITIKLAFEGKIKYLWVPCRMTDARFAALVDAFSADENEWIDKRIHLLLVKDDFTESWQVRVEVPAAKKK